MNATGNSDSGQLPPGLQLFDLWKRETLQRQKHSARMPSTAGTASNVDDILFQPTPRRFKQRRPRSQHRAEDTATADTAPKPATWSDDGASTPDMDAMPRPVMAYQRPAPSTSVSSLTEDESEKSAPSGALRDEDGNLVRVVVGRRKQLLLGSDSSNESGKLPRLLDSEGHVREDSVEIPVDDFGSSGLRTPAGAEDALIGSSKYLSLLNTGSSASFRRIAELTAEALRRRRQRGNSPCSERRYAVDSEPMSCASESHASLSTSGSLLRPMIVSSHHCDFPGDWDWLVTNRPSIVQQTFARDAADGCRLKPHSIHNICFSPAGAVDFDVHHSDTIPTSTVKELLHEHNYPLVWALLASHRDGESDAGSAADLWGTQQTDCATPVAHLLRDLPEGDQMLWLTNPSEASMPHPMDLVDEPLRDSVPRQPRLLTVDEAPMASLGSSQELRASNNGAELGGSKSVSELWNTVSTDRSLPLARHLIHSSIQQSAGCLLAASRSMPTDAVLHQSIHNFVDEDEVPLSESAQRPARRAIGATADLPSAADSVVLHNNGLSDHAQLVQSLSILFNTVMSDDSIPLARRLIHSSIQQSNELRQLLSRSMASDDVLRTSLKNFLDEDEIPLSESAQRPTRRAIGATADLAASSDVVLLQNNKLTDHAQLVQSLSVLWNTNATEGGLPTAAQLIGDEDGVSYVLMGPQVEPTELHVLDSVVLHPRDSVEELRKGFSGSQLGSMADAEFPSRALAHFGDGDDQRLWESMASAPVAQPLYSTAVVPAAAAEALPTPAAVSTHDLWRSFMTSNVPAAIPMHEGGADSLQATQLRQILESQDLGNDDDLHTIVMDTKDGHPTIRRTSMPSNALWNSMLTAPNVVPLHESGNVAEVAAPAENELRSAGQQELWKSFMTSNIPSALALQEAGAEDMPVRQLREILLSQELGNDDDLHTIVMDTKDGHPTIRRTSMQSNALWNSMPTSPHVVPLHESAGEVVPPADGTLHSAAQQELWRSFLTSNIPSALALREAGAEDLPVRQLREILASQELGDDDDLHTIVMDTKDGHPTIRRTSMPSNALWNSMLTAPNVVPLHESGNVAEVAAPAENELRSAGQQELWKSFMTSNIPSALALQEAGAEDLPARQLREILASQELGNDDDLHTIVMDTKDGHPTIHRPSMPSNALWNSMLTAPNVVPLHESGHVAEVAAPAENELHSDGQQELWKSFMTSNIPSALALHEAGAEDMPVRQLREILLSQELGDDDDLRSINMDTKDGQPTIHQKSMESNALWASLLTAPNVVPLHESAGGAEVAPDDGTLHSAMQQELWRSFLTSNIPSALALREAGAEDMPVRQLREILASQELGDDDDLRSINMDTKDGHPTIHRPSMPSNALWNSMLTAPNVVPLHESGGAAEAPLPSDGTLHSAVQQDLWRSLLTSNIPSALALRDAGAEDMPANQLRQILLSQELGDDDDLRSINMDTKDGQPTIHRKSMESNALWASMLTAPNVVPLHESAGGAEVAPDDGTLHSAMQHDLWRSFLTSNIPSALALREAGAEDMPVRQLREILASQELGDDDDLRSINMDTKDGQPTIHQKSMESNALWASMLTAPNVVPLHESAGGAEAPLPSDGTLHSAVQQELWRSFLTSNVPSALALREAGADDMPVRQLRQILLSQELGDDDDLRSINMDTKDGQPTIHRKSMESNALWNSMLTAPNVVPLHESAGGAAVGPDDGTLHSPAQQELWRSFLTSNVPSALALREAGVDALPLRIIRERILSAELSGTQHHLSSQDGIELGEDGDGFAAVKVAHHQQLWSRELTSERSRTASLTGMAMHSTHAQEPTELWNSTGHSLYPEALRLESSGGASANAHHLWRSAESDGSEPKVMSFGSRPHAVYEPHTPYTPSSIIRRKTSTTVKSTTHFDESVPVTTHHVVFEGDEWADILRHYPKLVHDTFVHDASGGLGIGADHIEDVRFTIGSLHVDFTVRPGSGVSSDEVHRRLHAHLFPLMNALRARRIAAPATTERAETVSLPTLGEKGSILHEDAMLADDVARQGEAAREQTVSLPTLGEKGSILREDAMLADDVARPEHAVRANTVSLPSLGNLSALRISLDRPGAMPSEHTRDATVSIFGEDGSDLFSLYDITSDGHHTVRAELNRANTTSLASAEEHSVGIFTTTHHREFANHTWNNAMRDAAVAVVRSVVLDVTDALALPPLCVTNVRVEAGPPFHIMYEVLHPHMLSANEEGVVEMQLEAYDFPLLNKLRDDERDVSVDQLICPESRVALKVGRLRAAATRGRSEKEKRLTTATVVHHHDVPADAALDLRLELLPLGVPMTVSALQRIFTEVKEVWSRVLITDPELLQQTFEADISQCVDLPCSNVEDTEINEGPPMMFAFRLRHPARELTEHVQAQVDAYDFPLMHLLIDAQEGRYSMATFLARVQHARLQERGGGEVDDGFNDTGNSMDRILDDRGKRLLKASMSSMVMEDIPGRTSLPEADFSLRESVLLPAVEQASSPRLTPEEEMELNLLHDETKLAGTEVLWRVVVDSDEMLDRERIQRQCIADEEAIRRGERGRESCRILEQLDRERIRREEINARDQLRAEMHESKPRVDHEWRSTELRQAESSEMRSRSVSVLPPLRPHAAMTRPVLAPAPPPISVPRPTKLPRLRRHRAPFIPIESDGFVGLRGLQNPYRQRLQADHRQLAELQLIYPFNALQFELHNPAAVYAHYCRLYCVDPNSHVVSALDACVSAKAPSYSAMDDPIDLSMLDPARLSTVEHLSVPHAIIKDAGFLPLVELLRWCPQLTVLDISDNELTNEPVEWMVHAAAHLGNEELLQSAIPAIAAIQPEDLKALRQSPWSSSVGESSSSGVLQVSEPSGGATTATTTSSEEVEPRLSSQLTQAIPILQAHREELTARYQCALSRLEHIVADHNTFSIGALRMFEVLIDEVPSIESIELRGAVIRPLLGVVPLADPKIVL